MTATTTPAAAPNATPPATREPTAFERFFRYVTTNDFLAQVAPFFGGSETQAKEFVRVVLNAVQKTPDLLYADRKSLLLSCMQAARDRLMPDGKKAVLTVYNTREKVDGREQWVSKVEYQPMSAGMIQKLYDSGHVVYADACAVFEKDVFEYERGDAPRIVHKPSPVADPGPIVAAYLVAKLKTGETKREVIFRRDVDKIRAASKAPNSPAWRDWFDQMAIKAVIKRGYKQLPSTPELDDLIARDNETLGFSEFGVDESPAAKPTTGADAINAEIAGKDAGAAAGDTKALTHDPGEKLPTMKIEGEQREPVTIDAGAGEKKSDAATATEDRPTLSSENVKNKLDAAAKAKSADKLDEAAAEISLVVSPKDQKALVEHYKALKAALEADDGK